MDMAETKVTERPILFSGEMVRAILEGRKTQTRRVMRTQPHTPAHVDPSTRGAMWAGARGDHGLACPYGMPGDRLWVRETWATGNAWNQTAPRALPGDRVEIFYDADGKFRNGGAVEIGKLRPGMFMPRWASRITLEVTGVRVQRVQEISEADAGAEGMLFNGTYYQGGPHAVSGCKVFSLAVQAYRDLWDHLNAKRGHGWDVNPWVWVIEFKRVA